MIDSIFSLLAAGASPCAAVQDTGQDGLVWKLSVVVVAWSIAAYVLVTADLSDPLENWPGGPRERLVPGREVDVRFRRSGRPSERRRT